MGLAWRRQDAGAPRAVAKSPNVNILLRMLRNPAPFLAMLFVSVAVAFVPVATRAQVSYTDTFNAGINYLTNGVAGTIWDGVYFGAGEFNNTGVGGGGPGSTIVCDAGITAPNTLTLQTTGTAWENADDDGFFLFKVVPGDFSASVRVVSPFDNSIYN